MIANYKFKEDITSSLLLELERNGIKVEPVDDGFKLSRGKGTVTLARKENAESGYVYQTFAASPLPFSASMRLSNEIGNIVKRMGGTNSEILEGVIPPRKRKIMKALYGLHSACILLGITLGAISYFKYGEAGSLFKLKPYGPIIGLVLGLGALVGIFGAQGIFLFHKNKKEGEG